MFNQNRLDKTACLHFLTKLTYRKTDVTLKYVE